MKYFVPSFEERGTSLPLWNLVWVLGILIHLPAISSAAELSDVHLGGFISQGYLDTSDNNYLVTNSRGGSGEINEMGLALSISPNDRTRIGVQFLARDLGSQGNNVVRLDWALGDYRWKDGLGVRVGKVKIPYGLYSEVRDIDVAHPFVLLPQGVYDERLRDFFTSFNGVDLYGSKTCSSWGDVDYEIYGGSLDVPDPTVGFWENIIESTGHEAVTDEQFLRYAEEIHRVENATMSFSGYGNTNVSLPWIVGGSAVWNVPLEGLRLGGSWLRSRWDLSTSYSFDGIGTLPSGETEFFSFTVDTDDGSDIDYITGLSAEYSKEDLVLAAEYTQQKTGGSRRDSSGKIINTAGEGYYVSASTRLRPKLSVASYYSQYWQDRSDRKGNSVGPYPKHVAWQHDFCAAASFDLSENWLLKVEQHWVDGVGLLSLSKNRDGDGNLRSERRWSYFMAKTTFHF